MIHKKYIKTIPVLLTLFLSFYPMNNFATETINTENVAETDVNSTQSNSSNDNNSEPVTSHNDNSQEAIASENTIESETNIIQPTISSQSAQEAVTNESNIEAFLDNEPLDTWMPDKTLQIQVASNLGVSVSDLTKEFLADKTVSIGIDNGQYGYAAIKDLSGVEFLKGYSIFYKPSEYTTTESLTAILGDHLDNLLYFNWYGNSLNYSQIDLYTVFKDCPEFFNKLRDFPFLDITGDIAMPSEKPLNIYPDSYKPDGKLSISIKDIGFWSSTDLKLFSEEDIYLCSDLIIKDNNKTIATYKYSGFDNATQSIIFSFDALNSDSFENLAGKKITYELPSLGNGERFSAIPNIRLDTMNNRDNFDVSVYQSHETFLFPNISFIFENEVTIRYQDIEGNTIAPDIVKTGNIDDAYTSEQLMIDGYTFKEAIGATAGTFSDTPQTVIYVYTKDPVVGGNITIKYQDSEGNQIAPDVVKTGNVGDTYTSEQLTIDGYTFKEVIGNPTGSFTDTAQSVIYVYTKNKINSPVEPTKPTGSNTKPVAKTASIRSTSKSTALPKTGEMNSSLFTVIGSMMLLVSGVYIFSMKSKKIN